MVPFPSRTLTEEPIVAVRWSEAFIPTLRDDPAEAEASSHKLLIRAGYIRQLMAGSYTLLPLAMRVRKKIIAIIREEMDAIGGQEFLLPALHPAEVWQQSGRWEIMGDEMFRLRDRKDADLCLGMTHEEIFATLATEMKSYRQLPQLWYQIQTKFRDEPRPKSGILRVREFTMKDSYSFDVDQAGLDAQFEAHRAAYLRIFDRMGLTATMVEASSGAMGGSGSVEFMVASSAGEDLIATSACGYAANLETATSALDPVEDPPEVPLPERFDTPDVRTIKALAQFDAEAPAERQIKTLVYVLDDQLTLVLLRGDHELQEQKLADATGAITARAAQPDEIAEALGALPGSLGAVGVGELPILADLALQGRRGFTTGANTDDVHLRHVDIGRDMAVSRWVDLRTAREGEACPRCGEPLTVGRAIEAGHIFKLGTRYAEVMGAAVLDADGETRTMLMGSYGIGVERNLAAIVESSHDDKGIIWPVGVAPFHAVVTVLRADNEATLAAAELVYRNLSDGGVETILDDRAERPGVKFADAELVGIPYRITVGPRGLESGTVELTERKTGETVEVAVADVVDRVTDLMRSS